MKVKSRSVEQKDKIEYLDILYTAVESLSSREEIKDFLRDVLTESERIMIGRRIMIARRLLDGQLYDQIMKEMKVGPDTIMRVH
ncbi:MAG: Trp family transcriptional regulator [Patescibacteria group bacterium]